MIDLTIGDLAPDFSLEVSGSKMISLSELRGKFVVLYFYPKDDTPGCTIEAKEFSNLKSRFDEYNAVILGVSKDTITSHEKFKTKCELNFDLASDTDTSVCQSYGVWGERSFCGKKYMGIQRATFLIDPEGKIADIWPSVSVKGHAEEVLNVIQKVGSL